MQSSGTEQGLRKKIMFAAFVLCVFVGVTIALQLTAEFLNATSTTAAISGPPGKTSFTRDDFRYGPQSWRPFNQPLNISSVPENEAPESWYIMFTRLNGTPYGGNPLMGRVGWVKVHYRFVDLAGKASFHVYASRSDSAQFLTNRQDGYGKSGYVVTGKNTAGDSTRETLPLSGPNHVSVTTSDLLAMEKIGSSEGTYFLRFDKGAGSGLDALHITTDPLVRKGQVTATSRQEGDFYITNTGGSTIGDVILMVAVNTTQPASFSLSISSGFEEATA